MQLTVDFWQFLGIASGLIAFCVTACAVVGRMLLTQMGKHLDERFTNVGERLDGIERASREEALQWRRFEREFLEFKATMPLNYVMRPDYVRGQSIIETKIDALAVRLENAQLRMIGAKNVAAD